jgi:hypothetical protein
MVAGADRTQVKGFRRNEALRSCQITPDRNWAGSGRPARRAGFLLVGDVSFSPGASLSPYTANGKPLPDWSGTLSNRGAAEESIRPRHSYAAANTGSEDTVVS